MLETQRFLFERQPVICVAPIVTQSIPTMRGLLKVWSPYWKRFLRTQHNMSA